MGSRPSTAGFWPHDVPHGGPQPRNRLTMPYLNFYISAKIFESSKFPYRFGSFLSLVPFVMLSSSYQRNISEIPPACQQLSPSLHTEFLETKSPVPVAYLRSQLRDFRSDSSLLLLLGHLGRSVLLTLSLPFLLRLLVALFIILLPRVLSDSLVCLLVHLF
jgi:hypothetical protein